MSVFLERFILPFCVFLVGVAFFTNPLKWDLRQRLSFGFGVILIAYFAAHTIQIANGRNAPTVQPAIASATNPATAQTQPSNSAAPPAKAPTQQKRRPKTNSDITIEQHSEGANSP